MKSILLLAMLYASLFAFPAKVIKISDGDTITVLNGKEQTKVRLYGIDAPEKKQDYGQRSRQFLASLIAGQVVEVEPNGKDRYKRTLGIIHHKGQDINAQMVLNGYAWVYVKYSRIYVDQEKTAREKKLGLWQSSDPTPPWQLRKR
ncbi:thermonuclease family protein [uncultured Campylobacter sp.]|jgi:ATP-dependent hsl protease ATP-binding subunit hslU|uniref:thermonuclease family protein n=1 Tax=uncultured Campylobacter sp. TaxID=218934 RepID=UPI002054C9B9|nr:thermonuclease family protein [uncultured Campylobacter sp.]DAO63924.1 MAG TPA: nuclease-like protein [Caudoviricetes sp.]